MAEALKNLAFLSLCCILLPYRSSAACTGLQNIRLQLSWVNSAEFAGFVLPNSGAAGFPQYSTDPNCLAVQVREGGPHYDPLQELDDDNADVALAEGAHVAQQIGAGKDYTIIASFFSASSLALVGLDKTALSSFMKLKLKKIGITRRQGYDLPIRLMLKNKGILDSEVTYVNQTVSAQNTIPELKEGRINVATLTLYRDLGDVLRWLNPATKFLRQASELAMFKTGDSSAPALHNVLVVKTSRIAALRSKLVIFLKVVAQTWLKCRDDEDSCLKAWPYDSPLQQRLLRESLRLIFPSSFYGFLAPAVWDGEIVSPLETAGLITSRSYPQAIDNSLIIDATLNINGTADNTYSKASLNLCADYDTTMPFRVCVGDEHTLCQQGYMPKPSGCQKCPAGKFSSNKWTTGSARMLVCETCPGGKFAPTTGYKACTDCAKGNFRSTVASGYSSNTTTQAQINVFLQATTCARCDPGRAASEAGMTACNLCSRGHASASVGSTTCSRCNDGTFAGSLGMTQCETCASNTSTRGYGAAHSYECACVKGTYRNLNGDCVACPQGFDCPVGSDEEVLRSFGTTQGYVSGQYPHLLPGYWASRADPLSLYLCRSRDFCPGGAPQSCAPYMEDIACSLCQRGYFRQGQKCEPCTGFDNTEFNYPTLQVVFGPIVIFALYCYMWDKVDQWGSRANELWSLAFLIVTHYQMVGIVVTSSVPWPSQIFGTLYVWEYFVDITGMLRLDCIGDSMVYRGFENGYTVMAMQPLLLLALFILFYILGLVIAGVAAAARKNGQTGLDNTFKAMGMSRFATKPVGQAIDPNVLFNNYMAIFYAFYISACFVSLELFMCYEHPNGKSTLTFGPHVQCDSQVWQRMLGEGILLMIPVCGSIAAFIFVALVAPSHFNKSGFRARFKFLLIKWRPDAWWWGPVVLLRALLLCLTHIISQEGQRQLLWQLAVLLTYAGCAAVVRPWRSWSANVLDLEVCGSLILFVSLCSNFVARSAWLDDHIAHFGSTFVFAVAACFVLTCLWIVICGLARLRTPWDKKLAVDAQTALAKFVGLDKKAAEKFFTRLSGQDREALRCAQFMLGVELTKDVKSWHYQWLTIGDELHPRDIIAQQGPRPSLDDEDPHLMFDTGDMFDDGTSQPTKWQMNPPHGTISIVASRGDVTPKGAIVLPASPSSAASRNGATTGTGTVATATTATTATTASATQEQANLPPGWRSAKAEDGQEYYYHADDPHGTTRWDRPTAEADAGAGVGDVDPPLS